MKISDELHYLADQPLPSFQDPQQFARELSETYRDIRRRILQLARAAAALDEIADLRFADDVGGYDLVLSVDGRPALGGPLGDNLQLRVGECPKCGRAIDYVGELGRWSCTNPGCSRGAAVRRPPSIESHIEADRRQRRGRQWGR